MVSPLVVRIRELLAECARRPEWDAKAKRRVEEFQARCAEIASAHRFGRQRCVLINAERQWLIGALCNVLDPITPDTDEHPVYTPPSPP